MDGNRDLIPAGTRPALDWLRGEPMLEELLRDPVLRILMRSDGIDPEDFRAFLRELRGAARARRQRDTTGGASPHPHPSHAPSATRR